MSINPPKQRRLRRDGLYTLEEKMVIHKYKQEYIMLTTRELRAQLLKEHILVDIFNYWTAQGNQPKDETESISQQKVMFTIHPSQINFLLTNNIVVGHMDQKQLASSLDTGKPKDKAQG